MAIVPGILAIDEPAVTDKRADTNTMTRNALVVERECVSIGSADNAATENIAAVQSTTPAGTEQGLVTRLAGPVPAGTNNIGDIDVLTMPDSASEHTRNEVFGQAAAIGGELDDTAPVAATEGNVSPVRITPQRALHSNLRNNAGTELGTATDPVRTDPTGTTTQPISAASLPLPAGASTAALQLPAGHTVDPTDRSTRLAGRVSVAASDGGAAIDPRDVSDRAARLVGQVEGRAAHNAALAGNPNRVGGRANAGQLAAVTDGVTTDLVTNRHGELRLAQGAPSASVFTNVNFPAANTRASSTRAAGAAGVRHVLKGLTVVLAAGATAPAAVQLDVRVRDGILDTGTILWQMVITLPATAGAMNGITRSGLWIPGTAATAMTIEFSAAGGANTFESVSMEIEDITE